MDKHCRPGNLDELAKLMESEQLNEADLQLIGSTIETLLQYFKSRAAAACGDNRVFDIRTGNAMNQSSAHDETQAEPVKEVGRNWTFEDMRLFEEQMKDFSGLSRAIMRVFTKFPMGIKISTAMLYEAVREMGIRRSKYNELLVNRDFTVATINRCGMKRFYGSEGPFILKRNKPLGDKRRDDLNPLSFWIEKV